MKYLVYRCRDPLGVVRGWPEGLYVPVERVRLPEGRIKERCALQGYLFGKLGVSVPIEAVRRHRVKPITVGEVQCHVEWGDLIEVQRRLNQEFIGEPPDPPVVYDFEPGDQVHIFEGHLFGGMGAVFAEYKGGGRGRVRTSFGYVDIGLQFLQKENG